MSKLKPVTAVTDTVLRQFGQAVDFAVGLVPGMLGQVTGLVQSRFYQKKSGHVGLPPGTPVHVGERKVDKPRITIIDYDTDHFTETVVEKVEECSRYRDQPTVTWINIDGLHEVELIEKLGQQYGLHSLVIEDIVNTDQRPKVEDYGDYLYVVLKMLSYNDKRHLVAGEQVSLILGPNFVLSFQESIGDVFDPVRERLRNSRGRIRSKGNDYLAYALLDVVVDSYFIILERLGEFIEALEKIVMTDPSPRVMRQLHHLKREMTFLRKSVYPLREVISGLERIESKLIEESTSPFLRDLYDHTIQVIDTIETFRDMVSGLFDIYLSSLSNRMNTVMQRLSLVATIFMPLTFIAGIYGMNFENMPELKMHNAYYLALGSMAIIGLGLAVYFKRKRLW